MRKRPQRRGGAAAQLAADRSLPRAIRDPVTPMNQSRIQSMNSAGSNRFRPARDPAGHRLQALKIDQSWQRGDRTQPPGSDETFWDVHQPLMVTTSGIHNSLGATPKSNSSAPSPTNWTGPLRSLTRATSIGQQLCCVPASQTLTSCPSSSSLCMLSRNWPPRREASPPGNSSLDPREA